MTDKQLETLLGESEVLRVTSDGQFIWHENADALIERGDYSSSPAMPHILRALRRMAALEKALGMAVATLAAMEFYERAGVSTVHSCDALATARQTLGGKHD